MRRRDKRFVAEKHRISRAGVFRVGMLMAISAVSLTGLGFAVRELVFVEAVAVKNEIPLLEPNIMGWKRRPDDVGGRVFLNKGLEINRVQAELFDQPRPEEVVLAPPPEDF